MRRKQKFFREIKEGESKEEYLRELIKKCWISKNGRRIYLATNDYFSDFAWNILYPNDPILKNDDFYIFHKDGNLLNEDIYNLEKINKYKDKEKYLCEIKNTCRIHRGRRLYGHGKVPFAQLVWNINHPEDPIVEKDGFQIHHKDTDSLNDDINNLEKLTGSEHTALHNIGNTYSVGYHHPSSKIVMVEYQIFSSILQAAKALKMCRTTIRKRLNSQEFGYFYINN